VKAVIGCPKPAKNPRRRKAANRTEARKKKNPAVANEILRQLGGPVFQRMTGARDLIGGDNYLALKLPARFAKDGINFVRITLTARDDYDLVFWKVRGANIKEIAAVSGIYADQLRDVFTQYTGLDLTMPRVMFPNKNARRGRRAAPRTEARTKKRGNPNKPCPRAPEAFGSYESFGSVSYNPKKRRKTAKRTEARRKNSDIHIDIGSHNAPEWTPAQRKAVRKQIAKNPAINIPKTVVILGAALDMEVRTKKQILLYSWNSPHQRGKRHAKKIEAFVCSNTLGNELYILPNTTKHVKPDRLIPLVERHRDAPDAARLFQRWADFPAHAAAVIEVPRVSLHRIGTACALSYYSDKWTGKTRAYIHNFSLEPEIYACDKSKIFTIFSKRIRVTKDGIKG
jgi:hypothetical protein